MELQPTILLYIRTPITKQNINDFLTAESFDFIANLTIKKNIIFEHHELCSDELLRSCSKKGFDVQFQPELTTETLLLNTIETTFYEGSNSVLVIDDTLSLLTKSDIEQALVKLHHFDVVIGPTKEQKCYLIGMKKVIPCLSKCLSNDSSYTLNETLSELKQTGRHFYLLPERTVHVSEDKLVALP